MIAGHTICLCDSCFGMLKKKFRRSEVNAIDQLETVVENSAKCNTAARFEGNRNGLQWYGWHVFFNTHFKPLKGIGKFHHFLFTADEPGVVFAKHPDLKRLSLQLDFQQTDNVISFMRLDLT